MTKKLTWALLAICLMTPCANAGIWDWFKREGIRLEVTDPFIDMRTGPGRGYPRFHSIEKGGTFTIYKKRTDWFKVRTEKGIEGWVRREDLSKTKGLDGELVNFTNPGKEDYIKRRWEFGFLAGDFGGADALTAYGGFHLTTNLSLEVKHTQTFSAVANNTLFSVNAVHTPFPKWRVSPFFTLGTGEVEIAPKTTLIQTQARTNPIYTVGGGTFIYISRRFLARIEYNNHTLLTNRNLNEEIEEWKAGFSVFF